MTALGGGIRRGLGRVLRPALLLLALLAAPAAVIVLVLLAGLLTKDVGATALILVLTGGSLVLLLAVILWLATGTFHPPAIAAALAWGALAAPLIASPANALWGEIMSAIIGGTPDTGWAGPITAGPIEETIKVLGVALVFVAWPSVVRDARSGLVAGMLVGLAFGAVEDALYLATVVRVGVPEPFETIGLLFLARAVTSGLYLHVAFTGIAGMGLGWALERPSPSRWAGALGALGLAATLHVLANAGPIMPPDLPWQADDLASLAMTTLIRSVPFAIVILLLLRLTPARVSGHG